EVVDDAAVVVAKVDRLGAQPRSGGRAHGCGRQGVVQGGHAVLLRVRPVATGQSRNGAPRAPVTTPTGKLVPPSSSAAAKSAPTTSAAPTSAAPTRVVRPELRRRAIGPARKATKAIGPAPATPTAASRVARASSHSARAGRSPRLVAR